MNRLVSLRAAPLLGALCLAACAGVASESPNRTASSTANDATASVSDDATVRGMDDATATSPDIATTRGSDGMQPGPSDGETSPADMTAQGAEGCEQSIPAAPPGPQAPPPVTDEDAPTGTVAGRLVHPDGSGIPAMRMLACTASICYWDETDSDGRFLVSDLTLEPLKMQTGDPSGTHLDLIFYHLLDTEEISELPEDIIVPLRDGQPSTPWAEDGGTVTLANGLLELSVEPGALSYPFGTLEDAVRAMRLEGADLPIYDWTPWDAQVDETFAFVVNPVGVQAEPGATLRVHGVTAPPCSVYRIWTVAAKTGALSHAGTATVVETDDGLVLVSDPDAEIGEFTTLVFSPLED